MRAGVIDWRLYLRTIDIFPLPFELVLLNTSKIARPKSFGAFRGDCTVLYSSIRAQDVCHGAFYWETLISIGLLYIRIQPRREEAAGGGPPREPCHFQRRAR